MARDVMGEDALHAALYWRERAENAEAEVARLRKALALAETAIGFAIAEKNSLSLTEMRMLQPRIDAALAAEENE